MDANDQRPQFSHELEWMIDRVNREIKKREEPGYADMVRMCKLQLQLDGVSYVAWGSGVGLYVMMWGEPFDMKKARTLVWSELHSILFSGVTV